MLANSADTDQMLPSVKLDLGKNGLLCIYGARDVSFS